MALPGNRRSDVYVSGDAWSPASLSPEGWWRADLGVTEESLEVTDWVNQGSESALDLSQSVASDRPDLIASDANFGGRATLNFDGGDVMPSANTTAWAIADDGDYSLIAIFRPTGAGVGGVVAIDGFSPGFQLSSRTSGAARFRNHDGTTQHNSDGTALTLNAVCCFAGVYQGETAPTNNTGRAWENGVGQTATTANIGAMSASQEFCIGALGAAGATGFTGQIAEVIFVKRLLTADEDAALASYFSRYGLSLPGVTQ